MLWLLDILILSTVYQYVNYGCKLQQIIM